MTAPVNPVTESRVERWSKSLSSGEVYAGEVYAGEMRDAACEIRRLQQREQELLETIAQASRRQAAAEDEANQEYTEKLLLRAECIRLRNAMCEAHSLLERVFPSDPQEAKG